MSTTSVIPRPAAGPGRRSLIVEPGHRVPVIDAVAVPPERGGRAPGRRQRAAVAVLTGPLPWLTAIAGGQVALSRASHGLPGAFEDEGLYVYMGHRTIDYLTRGEPLREFPGAYFSGAPGVYPPLAALADSVGGLQAVRDLSLAFIIAAMIGVYGIGRELFGRRAGVIGAGFYAVCGPVVYQSQWATFDAMTSMLLALGAWSTLVVARRNGLMWAPLPAALLVAAMFTKYAAVAFVPMIVALGVVACWDRWGRTLAARAAFMMAAIVSTTYFVLMLWGRDLLPGISMTTLDRVILNPVARSEIASSVVEWFGPWLWGGLGAGFLLTGASLVHTRRAGTRGALSGADPATTATVGESARGPWQTAAVLAVLGAGTLVGPLQQWRIGELTSLGKHLGFSAMFAGPVIGGALALLVRRRTWFVGVPIAIVTLALLVPGTVDTATTLRTGYSDDTELLAVLRRAVADNPGRPILGEQPSPERYALKDATLPRQWNDTYAFGFDGRTGEQAFAEAVRLHYFGVIYLSYYTPNGRFVASRLGGAQGADHYYNLVAKVPRYNRGERVGYWLVWTPQTELYTSID